MLWLDGSDVHDVDSSSPRKYAPPLEHMKRCTQSLLICELAAQGGIGWGCANVQICEPHAKRTQTQKMETFQKSDVSFMEYRENSLGALQLCCPSLFGSNGIVPARTTISIQSAQSPSTTLLFSWFYPSGLGSLGCRSEKEIAFQTNSIHERARPLMQLALLIWNPHFAMTSCKVRVIARPSISFRIVTGCGQWRGKAKLHKIKGFGWLWGLTLFVTSVMGTPLFSVLILIWLSFYSCLFMRFVLEGTSVSSQISFGTSACNGCKAILRRPGVQRSFSYSNSLSLLFVSMLCPKVSTCHMLHLPSRISLRYLLDILSHISARWPFSSGSSCQSWQVSASASWYAARCAPERD